MKNDTFQCKSIVLGDHYKDNQRQSECCLISLSSLAGVDFKGFKKYDLDIILYGKGIFRFISSYSYRKDPFLQANNFSFSSLSDCTMVTVRNITHHSKIIIVYRSLPLIQIALFMQVEHFYSSFPFFKVKQNLLKMNQRRPRRLRRKKTKTKRTMLRKKNPPRKPPMIKTVGADLIVQKLAGLSRTRHSARLGYYITFYRVQGVSSGGVSHVCRVSQVKQCQSG